MIAINLSIAAFSALIIFLSRNDRTCRGRTVITVNWVLIAINLIGAAHTYLTPA